MRALALLGLLLLAPLAAPGTAQARPQRGPGKAVRPKPARSATVTRRAAKPAQRGKARRRGAKRREVPPQMPNQVVLTAVDLVTGTAHLDVIGTTRLPATRLFILTDQTGRRFVPSFAECHPPPGVTAAVAPPGAADSAEGDEDEAELTGPELPATTRWRCSLTIPRLYRRAPLASLGMEWGNMTVAARGETVQRLWGEARAAAPLSAIAERPHDADSPPSEPTPVPRTLPPMEETEGSGLDDDPSDPSDRPAEGTRTARGEQPTE